MGISLPEQLDLSADELKAVRAIIQALRSVRYGSVNLTVHDGHLVEIQKVEKIRLQAGFADAEHRRSALHNMAPDRRGKANCKEETSRNNSEQQLRSGAAFGPRGAV